MDLQPGFCSHLLADPKSCPSGTLTDSEILQLGERFKAVVDRAKPVGRISMTDKARSMWAAVYSELSAAKPGLLGAIIARAEAQTIRLALIYELLDGSDQIDLSHLEAALAVWEYCELSATHVFGNLIGDPVADEILRALRSSCDGLTRNAIRDLFSRHQSSGRIEAALQVLLTAGRARPATMETGGRPVELWSAIGNKA
jgi:hypothetical protein